VAIAAPARSISQLPTGNGYGFAVYDASGGAIKQFLEHPYRYLHENPTNPDGEGILRRNLVYDTYFGVNVGGTGAWLGNRAPDSVGYVSQSTAIRATAAVAGVTTESYFVAPFGYDGNALIMVLVVTNTSASPQHVTAFSLHNFHMGTATDPNAPGADGEAIAWDQSSQSASETGPGGGAMIYAPIGGADVSSCDASVFATVGGGGTLTQTPSCAGTDIVNAFQKDLGTLAPGDVRTWGVAILFDAAGNAAAARTAWSSFVGAQTADQLLASLLAEQEAARTVPPAGLSTAELAVWRQSESVLRMAQVREPYTDSPRAHGTGMILASLPPGTWHVGWVRDGTYAIDALARTGHAAQAHDALEFFLDADAGRYASYVSNAAYRISTVRYFGDGLEESDFSGQPSRNIELDGWGLFLSAARSYVDATGDTAWLSATTHKGDVVYDAIKAGVADALAQNLEPNGLPIADASIWEVHWANRQHFLFTAVAAANGFCDMATLARRSGHTADIAHYRALHDTAVAAIQTAFVDSHGALGASIEKIAASEAHHDGAAVEAINRAVVDPMSPLAGATLDAMSLLQTAAGGFERVDGSTDPYDISEWLFVDLRTAAAMRRAGRTALPDALLASITAAAEANFDLLPELYNTQASAGPIGAYAGSIPMVGFGAGAYMMTLLDRAGLTEHTDCGLYDLGDSGDGGGGDAGTSGAGHSGCGCRANDTSPATALVLVGAFAWLARRRRAARARS